MRQKGSIKRRIKAGLMVLIMACSGICYSVKTEAESSVAVHIKYVDEKDQMICEDNVLCSVEGEVFRYDIPQMDTFQSYVDTMREEEQVLMYMEVGSKIPGIYEVYWGEDYDNNVIYYGLLTSSRYIAPGDQLVFKIDEKAPDSVEATIHLAKQESKMGVEVMYQSVLEQGGIAFQETPTEVGEAKYIGKHIHQFDFDIPLPEDTDITKKEGYEHIKVLKWFLNKQESQDGLNTEEDASEVTEFSCGSLYQLHIDDKWQQGYRMEKVSFCPVLGQEITTRFLKEDNTPIPGEEDVRKDVEIGERYATPAKEIVGYTLLDANDNEEKILTLEKAAEKIYRYCINNYSITYDLDGGRMEKGNDNPASYNVETATFTLHQPIKEGYIFKGWKCNGEDTITASVSIEKGTVGNLKFTAVWEEDKTMEKPMSDEPAEIDSEGEAPEDTTPENGVEHLATQITHGIQSLIRGTKYAFAAGTNYKVSGDETVYIGGNDFYVSSDGSYEISVAEEKTR